jgi:undecaprenyl-diphosphatase
VPDVDAAATGFLHGLSSPVLDTLMQTLTDLGSLIVIGPLLVVLLVGLSLTGWRHEGLFLAVAIAGSVVLNEAAKQLFKRPRPQLDWAQPLPDFSFPSGHTMNSLVFYGAIAVIVWTIRGRPAGLTAIVVAVVLAMLIGVSRIYLGYHYLTDVLGGLLAGAVWLAIVARAFGEPVGLNAEASSARSGR